MQILWKLAEVHSTRGRPLGVGPSVQGGLPLPPKYFVLADIATDGSGTPMAGATINLFRTADNAFIDRVVSGADGSYEFRTPAPASNYFVVAYKAGAPDVAGTTVNSLIGT